MATVDATTHPNAVDTQVNVDPNARVVVIDQRNDRFALKADRVTLPFDFLKVLVANILLVEAGQVPQVGGPPGVVGQGGAIQPAGGEARPVLASIGR